MIKPATLWSQFKTCDDSEWLGTLCRALGGQEVTLDYGQRQMLAAIQMDSGWMDERIEEKREAWRARQRKVASDKREKRENSQTHAPHAEVREQCEMCEDGVKCENSQTHASHAEAREQCEAREDRAKCENSQTHAPHDTSIHPSVRPSIHPSVRPKDSTNRTEPDNARASTYVRVCEAVPSPRPAPPSGSVRKIDVYNLPDADLFSCKYDTLMLYKSAFGDGFWSSALRTLGDGAMLDELSHFIHEVRAGEKPTNPAAAMTVRLKRLLDAAQRKEVPR